MAQVKNNRRGVWSIGAYVVLPGETGILPDAEWAAFKKSTVGAAMIEAGDVTEHQDEHEHKKGKK